MARRWCWQRTIGALVSCLVLAASVDAQERRITIPLERWAGDAQGAPGVEVTDNEGRDLTRAARQEVAGEQIRLSLPEQRGQFIVRPAEVVSLPLPAERTVLPGGVVQGEEAADGGDIWFRPTIVASPLPVSWNPALRRYSTGLLLGLQVPAEAAGAPLEHAVTMRLGFRGLTADPIGDVTLTQAGLEHEQQVDLNFLPTTQTPVLELRSTLGNVDLPMDVLPRLELRPVASSMPGFGLGTVTVDVLHLLPHGVPARVDEDTNVTLEIDGAARPEQDRVVIRSGNSQERFTLRSTGVGPVTVTARARGLQDRRTIEQAFPWTPLIAALFGGALGGYSRRFQKGAPPGLARARIFEGTTVAIVAYAAIVVGVVTIAIPAGIAATEAGAFVTGALAGFVGVAVIETLSRKAIPT